jgi:hypothetical protein
MSQAENRTTTILSRRRMLAGFALALPAATVAASAAAAMLAPAADTPLSGLATGVAPSNPDAALLKLVDEYFAALAEQDRLDEAHTPFEEKWFAQKKRPMPDALRVRPEDGDLGIPEPFEGSYYHGRSVADLNSETWCRCDVIKKEGNERILRSYYVTPTPAARARADEIINSWRRWEKKSERRPRGMRAVERARNATIDRVLKLEWQIESTPAQSLAGMAAKARIVGAHGMDPRGEMAESLARDLLALDGRA